MPPVFAFDVIEGVETIGWKDADGNFHGNDEPRYTADNVYVAPTVAPGPGSVGAGGFTVIGNDAQGAPIVAPSAEWAALPDAHAQSLYIQQHPEVLAFVNAPWDPDIPEQKFYTAQEPDGIESWSNVFWAARAFGALVTLGQSETVLAGTLAIGGAAGGGAAGGAVGGAVGGNTGELVGGLVGGLAGGAAGASVGNTYFPADQAAGAGAISGSVGQEALSGGADLDLLDAGTDAPDVIAGSVGDDTLASYSGAGEAPDLLTLPAVLPYTPAQSGDLIRNPNPAPASDASVGSSGLPSGLDAKDALTAGKAGLGLGSALAALFGSDPARTASGATARPASLVTQPAPRAGGGSLSGYSWAASDATSGPDIQATEPPGTEPAGALLIAGAAALAFYLAMR